MLRTEPRASAWKQQVVMERRRQMLDILEAEVTKHEVQSIEKEKSEINEMLGCVLLYRTDWVSLV